MSFSQDYLSVGRPAIQPRTIVHQGPSLTFPQDYVNVFGLAIREKGEPQSMLSRTLDVMDSRDFNLAVKAALAVAIVSVLSGAWKKNEEADAAAKLALNIPTVLDEHTTRVNMYRDSARPTEPASTQSAFSLSRIRSSWHAVKCMLSNLRKKDERAPANPITILDEYERRVQEQYTTRMRRYRDLFKPNPPKPLQQHHSSLAPIWSVAKRTLKALSYIPYVPSILRRSRYTHFVLE